MFRVIAPRGDAVCFAGRKTSRAGAREAANALKPRAKLVFGSGQVEAAWARFHAILAAGSRGDPPGLLRFGAR